MARVLRESGLLQYVLPPDSPKKEIEDLSAEARAVFEAAKGFGKGVSPDMADALAKTAIKAAKPRP